MSPIVHLVELGYLEEQEMCRDKKALQARYVGFGRRTRPAFGPPLEQITKDKKERKEKKKIEVRKKRKILNYVDIGTQSDSSAAICSAVNEWSNFQSQATSLSSVMATALGR